MTTKKAYTQSLQPGSLLQGGRYKIINTLGQGGFGITYLALQSGLDRKVAIKEFFIKNLCNRDEETSHVTIGSEGGRTDVNRFRDKFLKEARNIAKLKHPNIVRVIDIFEENGTAYYVMEYEEGGNLSDKIKCSGYLSESTATRYVLQVANALNYIHQQRMNHLDVKPANIMLNENDEAVLIDFGLSKQYDSTSGNQTSTTPVGISEGYAPMEQYKQGGVGEFSPETDIYALGATFFKLLTGITPPSASDINEDGVPFDELNAKCISNKAIEVIRKAMQGRKKDRMKDVKLFIKELEGEEELLQTSKEDKDEVTVLLVDHQKEELSKREDDEIKRNVESNVQKKVKEETVKKTNSKNFIWIIFGIIIIGVAAFGINQASKTVPGEIEQSQTFDKPTNVKNATIVLTKGHESKRNYVYTGQVDAEGLPHGQGEANYPETKSSSSCTFIGTFVHGITNEGEMVFSSGTKYKGTFDKDGYYNKGTWWEKDGYYFVGTFQKGDPYNGTWYTPKGQVDSQIINGK